MKLHLLPALLVPALLTIAPAPAAASDALAGLVSFDVFIPAGTGQGINGFYISNSTGPVYGPGSADPYVLDSLTFDNAVFTAFELGGSPQVFNLGDLPPGELLDSGGDPVIQFPSNLQFTSATFTATLSQSTFMLSDGSTFTASPDISVLLSPSSGDVLTPGVDLAPILLTEVTTSAPEPGTAILLTVSLLVLALRRAHP